MAGDANELAIRTESQHTRGNKDIVGLQTSCFCFVVCDLHLDMSRGNLPLKLHTANSASSSFWRMRNVRGGNSGVCMCSLSNVLQFAVTATGCV